VRSDGIAPAAATPPPYVTVLFSRSQWAVQENCAVAPGAVALDVIAADLADRGWIGTGSVVTNRILETAMKCTAAALYPSWATLKSLHSAYGWEATSHSATYPNMTQLTRSQQSAESCGTLATFTNHGFGRAWGLFSYPVNRSTYDVQANVVSTCFAFGRKYALTRNTVGTMAAPWWAKARTVNGGACNLTGSASASLATPYRYADPASMAALVGVLPGQWAIVQFHKLVTGSKLTGVTRWDCTSTDWRLHWSNRTEVYCWNDYQRILAGIPSGAVVTDPATVARSWGSNPKVLAEH
jgi:hypothetical protein